MALAPLRRRDGTPIVRPRTVRALRDVAEALFSRAGVAPPIARLDFLERETEDFLARAGGRSRTALTVLTFLVTWLAPMFIGRLAPLGALPIPDRVRALLALEDKFGEPLLAVKALLCLHYYEHPDAAREVGFDGDCLVATDHARRPR